MMIPLVAASVLFIFIFLPGQGLIDHYLGFLGAGNTNWLGNPSLAMPLIIAITVWKMQVTISSSSSPASPAFPTN